MRDAVSSETELAAAPEAGKPSRSAATSLVISPPPPVESGRPSAAAASVATHALEPALSASTPAEAFTELELDGDSLLHAVERAARLGVTAPIKAPDAPRPPAVPVSALAERPDKLPEVPLFSDLPPVAFIELFERGLLLRFNKGQRVFEQGSVGQSFFIVCQGSVRVARKENDRVRELAVLPEGSFFGEMALLSDSPRTASVDAACDETELLEISAALLSELSQRHPTVAAALSKFCRQRLLLNVMHSSAIFRPFDGKDRRALIERFQAREVTPSTAIIREGEHSDGLYVILSGAVEVAREGRVLAHLREGEIFGEMSLLEKAPAGATVRASRRTSLLRLPRRDFDELIMSHPQILALVSELTDDRRRQTDAILSRTADAGEEGLLLV
jgi:CRP-like cAMP-binding protein